jgi:hypothetical protein
MMNTPVSTQISRMLTTTSVMIIGHATTIPIAYTSLGTVTHQW